MEHDLVFVVDDHELCEETGYCKRCGLHVMHAEEMNWACQFATNTFAISHIRRAEINDEKMRSATKRTMELVEKVREVLKQREREEEILAALETYSERGEDK